MDPITRYRLELNVDNLNLQDEPDKSLDKVEKSIQQAKKNTMAATKSLKTMGMKIPTAVEMIDPITQYILDLQAKK